MTNKKTVRKVRTPRYNTGALLNPKDNRDISYSKVAQAISLPTKSITDITMIPVLNQGYLGTCVAHAIAFVKMYQEYKETGKILPFSRRFLYSIAWKLGLFAQGQQGLYPRDGAKTSNSPGNYPKDTIDDNSLPHDVYVSLETTDAMKKEAEIYRSGFAFLTKGNLTEMKTAIVREGVFTLSLSFEGSAGWSTGKLTKPSRVESLHYITVYGYEDIDGDTIFYFRNSWGKDWGTNGCGQFSFKDYKTFIHDGIVFTDVPNKLIEEARAMAYKFEKNMRGGDRNYDVQKLQERLRDEGFYNYPEVTGYFGDITLQAVKEYQKANKINPVSGYVGPLTREKLNAQKKKVLSISSDGLSIIKRYEGLHDGNKSTPQVEPMLDPVGYPTIGWGSRYDLQGKEVTMMTSPITLEEAEILLKRDVKSIERELSKYTLNQNQFDALCSFMYNCGIGAFQKSQIASQLKVGGKVTESMFTVYSKARDQRTGLLVTLQGLVRRRQEEFLLFSKK